MINQSVARSKVEAVLNHFKGMNLLFEIYEKIAYHRENNCLCLLPIPTGVGKTFSAAQLAVYNCLLCEIKKEGYEHPDYPQIQHLAIVTTTKANIENIRDELLDCIEKLKNLKNDLGKPLMPEFISRMRDKLFVLDNKREVFFNLLSEIFGKRSEKELLKSASSKEEITKALKGEKKKWLIPFIDLDALSYAARSSDTDEYRKFVNNALKVVCAKEKSKPEAERDPRLRRIFSEVFFVEEGGVAVLSASKLASGTQTFEGYKTFDSFSGWLWIIDEFDGTKSYVNSQFFAQSDQSMNIRSVFEILNALSGDLPGSFLKRLEAAPENLKTKVLNDHTKFADGVSETEESLHPTDSLHYSQGVWDEKRNKRKPALFVSDSHLGTFISTGIPRYVSNDSGVNRAYNTPEGYENVMQTTEWLNEIENSLDFSLMTSLSRFRDSVNKAFGIEDSLGYILDVYGRDSDKSGNTQSGVKFYLNNMMNRQKTRNLGFGEKCIYTTGQKTVILSPSNQEKDADEHTLIKINNDRSVNTAENFLLTLARKNKVIGMSATCLTNNVITNYNLSFLGDKLGDDLVYPDDDAMNRIAAVYKQRNDYKDLTISVKQISANSETAERVLQRAFPEAGLNGIKTILNNKFKADMNSDYFYDRFIRIILAICNFIKNDGVRMLCFLSRHFVEQKELFDKIKESINEEFSDVGKIVSFDFLDAKGMREEGMIKSLKEERSSAQNVKVIFTHYQTAGAGLNMQFHVNSSDLGEYVNVRETPYRKGAPLVDIDGLYLEKPTNLLMPHKDNENFSNHEYFMIRELQYCGAFSEDETARLMKDMIDKEDTSRVSREINTRYMTKSDYYSHLLYYITQATGRIARTPYRRKNVQIMIDENLMSAVKSGRPDFDERTQSFELTAVLDKAREMRSEAGASPVSVDHIRLANRMVQRTRGHQVRIHDHLQMIQKQSISADTWNNMRRHVLTTPVLDKNSEFKGHGLDNTLYHIELPQEAFCYWYYSKDTTDKKEPLKISFTEKEEYVCVSYKNARLDLLMMNKVIREHFERNGFATSWAEGMYILSPPMFQAIYLGALGEEALAAVLIDQGFKVKHLTGEDFEKFDMIVDFFGTETIIDVKNFGDRAVTALSEDVIKKSYYKMRSMGVNEITLCRLFSEVPVMATLTDGDLRINQIGLLCPETGVTHKAAVDFLKSNKRRF